MLLVPGLAAGADERVARILEHDSNVAAIDRSREDFFPITTTEFGFSPEAVEGWRSAVKSKMPGVERLVGSGSLRMRTISNWTVATCTWSCPPAASG
ncbi:hypothetical protein [Devosia submarina]|uniref:hypothetical protein n=1 Tax=Devosia submarina TaxID=1173082 RepID=UPI000D334E75|nr:hypothetical protein [Devosia submarina]